MGDVIHHVEDDHGPLDVVDENGGKLRSLHFGSSARQSTMFVARPHDLALEYTHCMMTALPFLAADPSRALMLGLGGGSMVKFVRQHCPDCRIDVAELRSQVVDVARQFFHLPDDDDRLAVHVTDGGQFLQLCDAPPWDLLLLDLHTSAGMAPVVFSRDFLPMCRQHVAEGGVLAANLWYGVDMMAERRVRRLLEANFPRVLYLPVAGKRNCIAIGLTDTELPAELVDQAQDWEQRSGLPLLQLTQHLLRRSSY